MLNKIICLANFKGGVGKTTSTINIGYAMANQGYKVCLIDLDPQSNLTISLGLKCEEPSTYSLLVGKSDFKDVIKKINDNISILPAHLALIKADKELASVYRKEDILSKKCKAFQKDFDFILIDTPPNLGTLTINGLVASDFVFTPIESEFLALQGFAFLTEAIDDIEMEIDGIFVTKYDKRKVLNRKILESLEKSCSKKLFKTKIRDNISLAESQGKGQDIFSYESKSHGAEDYANLTEEIVNRIVKGEVVVV